MRAKKSCIAPLGLCPNLRSASKSKSFAAAWGPDSKRWTEWMTGGAAPVSLNPSGARPCMGRYGKVTRHGCGPLPAPEPCLFNRPWSRLPGHRPLGPGTSHVARNLNLPPFSLSSSHPDTKRQLASCTAGMLCSCARLGPYLPPGVWLVFQLLIPFAMRLRAQVRQSLMQKCEVVQHINSIYGAHLTADTRT